MNNNYNRSELASLLSRVLYRLLTQQKLPDSAPADLAVSPETLLSVTNAVNTNRDQGDA